MNSILKKSGLSAIFAASAFMLFSATSTPAMAQEPPAADPTDLVETFGDLVDQGSAVEQLVNSLKDGGFQVVGMGTVMGQRGPSGYIAVFANEHNEWRMLSMDNHFKTAQVVNEGTAFSAIDYRYNLRINYEDERGGAALIPVRSQGGGDNCMEENVFARKVIKENFSEGYLLQGYDSDNDIMKVYVNNEGGFLGTSVEQNLSRTTCGMFQGESFTIADDFKP